MPSDLVSERLPGWGLKSCLLTGATGQEFISHVKQVGRLSGDIFHLQSPYITIIKQARTTVFIINIVCQQTAGSTAYTDENNTRHLATPCCVQGTVQGWVHWWSTHHFEDILHLGNTAPTQPIHGPLLTLFSIVEQILKSCGLQTVRAIEGGNHMHTNMFELVQTLAFPKWNWPCFMPWPTWVPAQKVRICIWRYAALHAWPFPLSIGIAYLHIPQFLQWSPSCRCEAVRSLISRHVPTSWAESQWWSRQRMTSSGSRRVSTAISPWYLGKSMADSRNTLHSVCNHLWSIWIYLYILCRQCGSWNFNTGARENDSVSELT